MVEKILGLFCIMVGLFFVCSQKSFAASLKDSYQTTGRYLHSEKLSAFMIAALGIISLILGISILFADGREIEKALGVIFIICGLLFMRYCKILGVWYDSYIKKIFEGNTIDRYSKIIALPIGIGFIIFGILLALGIINIGT